MNQAQFDTVLQDRIGQIRKTLARKASEYAHGDRLSNFKSAAALMDCSSERALFGMIVKHIVALKDFINELEDGNTIRPQEYWNEKTGDIINYMILLEALVKERLMQREVSDAKSRDSNALP